MKSQVGMLDAVPSKRLFLSIIADYDLNKSICELVDNGFDVWIRGGKKKPINIKVWLDEDQGIIRVEDDAGGLARDELRYIVGPGQTGSAPTDETIGIFGVGTKRAVVALAKDITIRTRHEKGKTYQVEFDEAWLEDDEWELPLYQVSEIPPRTTQVELHNLRDKLTEDVIDQLRAHLGSTYARFIEDRGVSLILNDVPVASHFFDDWSYPPDYEPRHYTGELITPKGRSIQVDVLAGLSSESSPTAGEYGVYFYCNDRLVAPAMKSFEVGFTRGQAGLPHPKIALTKVIVSLKGDAGEMPWNSSKSDISTKHHTFIALHGWLVTVVTDYARISRVWTGEWPEKVFAYPIGNIVDIEIEDFIAARKSFLPDPPKSRPRFAERVVEKNQKVARKKPWVVVLYEAVVAATTISKQPLTQANWIAFSLLDMALISAFKFYLLNEIDVELTDKELKGLLSLSPRISSSLKEYVSLPEKKWEEIQNMAKRREDLMYSRTVPSISNDELEKARNLVQSLLKRLCGIDLNA